MRERGNGNEFDGRKRWDFYDVFKKERDNNRGGEGDRI